MARSDHQWRILGVWCLAVLLVVIDNTIVNVALPSLSRDLHATNSQLQWIVDGYSLPFAALMLEHAPSCLPVLAHSPLSQGSQR